MSSYMERTCMPRTKTLLHIHILPVWEEMPYDLGGLTPNLLYKERSYIQGILVNSTPLYKHQVFSSLRYVKFPNSHTFEFLEIQCSAWSLFSYSLSTLIGTRVDNQLTDDFVHHHKSQPNCDLEALQVSIFLTCLPK